MHTWLYRHAIFGVVSVSDTCWTPEQIRLADTRTDTTHRIPVSDECLLIFSLFQYGANAAPTRLHIAFHHTTLFIVSFFYIAFHLLLLRLCVLQISFWAWVFFFLCLLTFFVFSLFNFLVCAPHMTWSVLNTEWNEGLKD